MNYREYFVNLRNKIHLAACSHGPLLKSVLEALKQYENDLIEYGNPWELWIDKVEESRKEFGELINAKKMR
jgi:selenocysteine lyase/cysteine desulfurase